MMGSLMSANRSNNLGCCNSGAGVIRSRPGEQLRIGDRDECSGIWIALDRWLQPRIPGEAPIHSIHLIAQKDKFSQA